MMPLSQIVNNSFSFQLQLNCTCSLTFELILQPLLVAAFLWVGQRGSFGLDSGV